MQRMTRQRLAVLGLLDRQSDFRSAQQIHDDLEGCGARVGLSTV
ncbi:MAG: transcriptional repressor, partial [Actinomycetota bacterium]